jgi:hypothetical protein
MSCSILIAIDTFNECLGIYPGDTVSRIYLERCLRFKENPSDANWNGVIALNKK